MKKMIVSVCALVLLAGCGSSNDGDAKTTSKTCSMEASGMKATVKIDAKDDIVKTLNFEEIIPSTSLGKDMSKVTDKELDEMGNSLISTMGLGKEDTGMEFKFAKSGSDFKVTMTFDMEKAGASVKDIGLVSGNTENVKLDDMAKDLESSGFTCK